MAAAWTDGEPSHEEINSMKDLLFRLPQLSSRQWASLQMYIETPVDPAERARLVEELRNSIRTPEDRDLALEMLDELMRADGEVTEEEEQVAAEIKAAIESVDVGLLTRLVKDLAGRRTRAVAGAPNREDYFEDYVKNKVYYGVRRRLDLGEGELDVGDELLRALSLAGGMMAQVARVNPEVTDAEVTTMAGALQTHWHLTPEQAAFVAEVAVSETASLFDKYRLARQFANACDYHERVEFLDVLFAVAAADGEVSYEEIEEIRAIAQSLKLTHQDFIEAKLKIPRDQRQQ
ncbi:MAG: TerB family tellurite resistance protein [Anaerolineae bacterium]